MDGGSGVITLMVYLAKGYMSSPHTQDCWSEPVPFLVVVLFFHFGRPTLGLTSCIQGITFWLGLWVGSVYPMFLFHFCCLCHLVSWKSYRSKVWHSNYFVFTLQKGIFLYVHWWIYGNSPVCTLVNSATLPPSFLNVLRFKHLYLHLNIDIPLYKCLVVIS